MVRNLKTLLPCIGLVRVPWKRSPGKSGSPLRTCSCISTSTWRPSSSRTRTSSTTRRLLRRTLGDFWILDLGFSDGRVGLGPAVSSAMMLDWCAGVPPETANGLLARIEPPKAPPQQPRRFENLWCGAFCWQRRNRGIRVGNISSQSQARSAIFQIALSMLVRLVVAPQRCVRGGCFNEPASSLSSRSAARSNGVLGEGCFNEPSSHAHSHS